MDGDGDRGLRITCPEVKVLRGRRLLTVQEALMESCGWWWRRAGGGVRWGLSGQCRCSMASEAGWASLMVKSLHCHLREATLILPG